MQNSPWKSLFLFCLPVLFFPASTWAASPATTPGDPLPEVLQESEEWEGDFLYRVLMVRAAPGRQLELIELLKEERDLLRDGEEPLPYWMRHTQGDQWDLMIFYPMGSFHEYYDPEAVARRYVLGEYKGLSLGQLQEEAALLISYREEFFVRGPEPQVMDVLFSENDFYHVEIFVALPGRKADLMEERRMENRYLRALGRPENLIFSTEVGGPWDAFTLGFYRDLQHYAQVAVHDPEAQEEAAVSAGFQGAGYIGNYMRSLILYHRDTLAVSIPWW